MALPRLKNDIPKYELTIPSTGNVVKYRPFLVKEQKVLLMAFESKDNKQILNSMLDCLSSCVPKIKLDPRLDNLTTPAVTRASPEVVSVPLHNSSPRTSE